MQLFLKQQNEILTKPLSSTNPSHFIPTKISTFKVVLLSEVDLCTIICSSYKLLPACKIKKIKQDRNSYLCVVIKCVKDMSNIWTLQRSMY